MVHWPRCVTPSSPIVHTSSVGASNSKAGRGRWAGPASLEASQYSLAPRSMCYAGTCVCSHSTCNVLVPVCCGKPIVRGEVTTVLPVDPSSRREPLELQRPGRARPLAIPHTQQLALVQQASGWASDPPRTRWFPDRPSSPPSNLQGSAPWLSLPFAGPARSANPFHSLKVLWLCRVGGCLPQSPRGP